LALTVSLASLVWLGGPQAPPGVTWHHNKIEEKEKQSSEEVEILRHVREVCRVSRAVIGHLSAHGKR
jgi:hypothetical protein